MLEVEHASVAEVFISNDVERGLWGVGASWEWLLDQLDTFLRDEAPDTTDETAAEEAATLRGLAWSTLVEAAFTAALADPTPTQGTHGVSGDPQTVHNGRHRQTRSSDKQLNQSRNHRCHGRG